MLVIRLYIGLELAHFVQPETPYVDQLILHLLRFKKYVLHDTFWSDCITNLKSIPLCNGHLAVIFMCISACIFHDNPVWLSSMYLTKMLL